MPHRREKTFTLPAELVDAVEQTAEEQNEYDSRIAEQALEEYLDRDRTARVEEKLDQLLEQVEEGGPSADESEEKKEKSQTTFSHDSDTSSSSSKSITSDRPDEILDTLDTETRDVVTRHDIVDAIDEWWGDATDYMIEKYVPKVGELLEENGWQYLPEIEKWCANTDAETAELQKAWNFIGGEANSPSTAEDVDEAIDQLSQNQARFIEADITDEDNVVAAIKRLNTHQQRMGRG